MKAGAEQQTALPGSEPEKLTSMIEAGTSELGLTLSALQLNRISQYLALLLRWNKVYNLTAIRSAEEMVTHHILDSLTVIPHLGQLSHLLDVGAGAGLPGIMLAIYFPDLPVALIDTVQKKTAFLSQVKAELNLKNVTVHTGRVEKLRVTDKFDGIISRAFSDLKTFVCLSGHLLSEKGLFYAMKGVLPSEEMASLPKGYTIRATLPLKVPFLEAARHLLLIEKTTG